MIDGYGRTIDYVRISVTDRCNLRCVYCMPEEGIGSISHEEILRFGEIERVCQILAENGIQKIKLTGGEPLVRRRLPELAAALKQIPGIKSLTITTNGVLLEEMYDALADAGVDSVTISLDTLDASVYRQLTRRDEIAAVRRGLRMAIQKGRMQIKINCVPVLGIEEQKLLEVAELAKNHNVHVRFIEMMPIGHGNAVCLCERRCVEACAGRGIWNLYPVRGRGRKWPVPLFRSPWLSGADRFYQRGQP